MMRTMIVLVAMTAAACGGSDDDPAADECRAFADLACDRVVECGADTSTHDECVDGLENALPGDGCADADQVSAGYEMCMTELAAATCTELFPAPGQVSLPPACSGVILFE